MSPGKRMRPGQAFRRARSTWGVAVVVAATALVAGCASGASGAAAGSHSGELIIDLNGPLSDPYFGAMKQGADVAAKAFGVDYQYVTPKDESNFVADDSPLIQQAIARHPSAIVIGDFVPSAFDPLIRQATAAGIPVVVVDTGLENWQADGAIGFVGVSRQGDGEADGAQAVKSGSHHLLCVNQAPVNPTLHQECQGAQSRMTDAGGTLSELDIPIADSSSPTVVTQDIQGFLASHPEIDGVLTLNSAIATDALAAVKAAGRTGQIKVGTEVLSTGLLNSVRTGELSWIDDAQTYLQGFYSLQIAVQYERYRIHPTQPIITGGLIITKDNVGQALDVQKRFPGLRGAA